jgi:hypothetical protein
MMSENRFLARPDDLDRTLDTVLVQTPGRQGEDDLHRHIFTATKRPADGWIDNTHLIDGKVKRMGYLFLIFMCPLAGYFDGDTSLFIDIGDPGFRL